MLRLAELRWFSKIERRQLPAGAGEFAVNMNIFLLFSPLKMAGFLRVKSGAGHHAGMAEERAFSRPVAVIYKAT